MPIIYLSPSTQEFNPYITTGTEEEWMNRLADRMEPYLTASGIQFVRNTPDMTAASSIRQSNEGNYDLHLALHSNALGGDAAGSARGIIAFYFPGSTQGERAAQLIADGLKEIYPLPNLVRAETSTAIGEVRRTRAPSVLLELGFHDNREDAVWIENNLDAAARSIVLSLTEYFGIPFFEPQPVRTGVVQVSWGYLNVRARPEMTAPVVAQVYDGAQVEILGEVGNWYLVRMGGVEGYANGDFIAVEAGE